MEVLIFAASTYFIVWSSIFITYREHHLAIATMAAYIFLNAPTEPRSTYITNLFFCGLSIFASGYPYFLTQSVNRGVYLHIISIWLMGYSLMLHTKQILDQYREEFQAQNEQQEEDSEDSEEERVTPEPPPPPANPTIQIPPIDEEALLSEEDAEDTKED